MDLKHIREANELASMLGEVNRLLDADCNSFIITPVTSKHSEVKVSKDVISVSLRKQREHLEESLKRLGITWRE